MFNFRIQINKAKAFVQKHPTVVACAATAAVTYRFTHVATLRGAMEEASALAYNWGQQNGVLEIQNVVLMAFVDEKGLKDEFVNEFLPNLN